MRKEPGSRAQRCRLAHRAVGLLLPVSLAAACGGNEYVPPPPPTVTVARPQIQDVTRYAEYTGTTRAVESIEVRARVKGFLQSMHYQAGDYVQANQLLFVIDPEPFEVALEAARAELASNEAELALATTEYERTSQMFKRGATSELDLIRKRAQRDKQRAAVEASRAAVRDAELDLDYAHVKAPVAGRVGRHLVDIGNLVGAEGATHLADLVQYAPLHVYFHLSERDLLDLQQQISERRREAGTEWENRPRTVIALGRANEQGHPHEGVIDYTALEVDPDTGTFEIRGILPNEGELDEIIVPGTFVRVRLPVGSYEDALLVPEVALGADQNGRYLLVVNSQNVVEHRRVTVGSRLGEQRVILSGLRAEDDVVVNGLMRARPGATVQIERAGSSSTEAAARGDG